MATRSELYSAFGPKLVDALAQVILSEINILRAEAGLAERTSSQLVDAIAAKLGTIGNYDWMSE